MSFRRHASTKTTRVHDCNLSVATPTTLLPSEQMQSLRHAPHRLGSPYRPGRRISIAVFRLGGRVSGSRLPPPHTRRRHRIEPWAELLHLQKTHPLRNGLLAIPGHLLHKRVPQAASLQRLPPVAADKLMEMPPTRRPRPASQSTNHMIYLR